MTAQRATQRVAIVTGGAQGIGNAIARRLAQDEVKVVIADINATGARDAAELLGGLGVPTDVSDPTSVAALVATVLETYGRIDILVNDAAIVPFVPYAELTFEEWRRVMSVNVDGLFLMCRAVGDVMQEAQYGRIINIASNVFVAGTPNLAHYVASKGAVIGFTRALATELGSSGITVNAVAPGLTESEGVLAGAHAAGFDFVVPMQAIPRRGMPDDIAPMVAFLASEEARWVTGSTVVVDGGHTRH
jgi:3-oxoacyl-[acyl-carrier protein] reductase/pyridoxal 4-dehydrogenase